MRKIALVVGLIGIMTVLACHHELSGNNCADGNLDACNTVGLEHKHWWDVYILPGDDMSLPPGDGDPSSTTDGGIKHRPNCMTFGTCSDMSVTTAMDMSNGEQPSQDLSSAADLSSGWACDGKIVKLDSDQVGVVGASVSGNDLTITITSWNVKTDQADSYCGFSYTASGSGTLASYQVKGGLDFFEGYSSPWSNPYGCTGPLVHGVSHIDFCIW